MLGVIIVEEVSSLELLILLLFGRVFDLVLGDLPLNRNLAKVLVATVSLIGVGRSGSLAFAERMARAMADEAGDEVVELIADPTLGFTFSLLDVSG